MFKALHSFTLSLPRTREKVETRTEGGQTISVTSTVTEATPFTISLKEPTRRERDALAMFNTKMATRAVMELGLVPKAILVQKITKDHPGSLYQEDDPRFVKMNAELKELSAAFITLDAVDSPDTKKRKDAIQAEFFALVYRLNELRTSYDFITQHTAESYAENKMLTWLVLMLSYMNGEPLFKGANYEARETYYLDAEEQGDDLIAGALPKLSQYWAAYLYRGISTPEEFAKLDAELTPPKKEEAAPVEAAPSPVAATETPQAAPQVTPQAAA